MKLWKRNSGPQKEDVPLNGHRRERNAEVLLHRGFRQLREEPAPQHAMEAVRRELGLRESSLPPTVPSPGETSSAYPRSGRWSVPALATAIALGGLAGFWVSQRNPLDDFSEPPIDLQNHNAKGRGIQPMITEEYGPAIQENLKGQSVTAGPIQLDVERVRLLQVPKGKGYLEGAYVYLGDARIRPADPLEADRHLYAVDLLTSHRPNLHFGGILRTGRSSHVLMWDDIKPIWTSIPSQGIPFQYEWPIMKPEGGPAPKPLPVKSIQLKAFLWSAPHEALQQWEFGPGDLSRPAKEGTGQYENSDKQWRVQLTSFNTQPPDQFIYRDHKGGKIIKPNPYRAIAKVAFMEEETSEKYFWPKLAVAPPWKLFTATRLDRSGEYSVINAEWQGKLKRKEAYGGLLFFGLEEPKKGKATDRKASEAIPPLRMNYVPWVSVRRDTVLLPPIPMQPASGWME